MLAAIAISGAICGVLGWRVVHPSPADALREFMSPNRNVAEDQLIDPLILAGDEVVPLVLRELRRRDMPGRRYAILFLGNVQAVDALPTLEGILHDETEDELFRGDALHAIAMINRRRAVELAGAYENADGFLGSVAGEVVQGRPEDFKRRTYWDALLGKHD